MGCETNPHFKPHHPAEPLEPQVVHASIRAWKMAATGLSPKVVQATGLDSEDQLGWCEQTLLPSSKRSHGANMAGWKIHHLKIGKYCTSSSWVHFPASHVSVPEGK